MHYKLVYSVTSGHILAVIENKIKKKINFFYHPGNMFFVKIPMQHSQEILTQITTKE